VDEQIIVLDGQTTEEIVLSGKLWGLELLRLFEMESKNGEHVLPET
jgi:hypothetical protein